ncbi:hypothetical protein FRUB_00801 [Fimbriiglobus ruber]|uniref:DUF1553 domain-containing protein n=1 Tax=Fimbriiglobus ruber TaxID=1908690 RepID=A0A225E0L4_9BACT|nr:hypothetical protein FRUB_00801 [Fimbriiglobus ruber]
MGRIPTVAEAREFLDDISTDKRAKLVDRLLASPEYTANAARLWRSILVPQATTNPQTQYLGVSVEAWVRDRLRTGATDDMTVRDLLTARLDYLDWTPDRKANPAPGLSPVGFYQANDLKPETVGSAVARTFLGLKLECALCHDHPFDKWTQKQAWETAAFFAGVAPLEPEIKPASGLVNRRELKINDTASIASSRFLDGVSPNWAVDSDPRKALAAWLVRKDNPYFARVMANRVWASLFGVGLVDPVDDWGPHNVPSHPQLLDDLAAAYSASGFDPKTLIRAIVLSDAYQRTSHLTHPTQSDPRRFARMNVKGLSAEQLFDSLALATGHRDPAPATADLAFGWPARSPRGLFIAKFGGGAGRTDMQVSILQALSLMNGDWLADQTNPTKGAAVKAIASVPFLDDAGRVEVLFLSTLSRRPTKTEADRYLPFLTGADDKARATSDILWVLVNSHEFLVNH